MSGRHVLAAITPALLLAACHREKNFDERYADARKAIDASAAAIDAEIASRESEAAAVEEVRMGNSTRVAGDAPSEEP